MFVFFYVAAVRQEISDETDRETGRTKAISSVPIHLSIFSPNGELALLLKFCYFLYDCADLNICRNQVSRIAGNL